MSPVSFNPTSMQPVHLGALREVAKESQTCRTGYAVKADNPVAPGMFDVPDPDAGDPLRFDHVFGDAEEADTPFGHTHEEMHKLAKKIGYEGITGLGHQINLAFRERCEKHGVEYDNHQLHQMSRSVARALLSTDAAQALMADQPLAAGQNPKERFLEAGLALVAMVKDGRIELSEIFDVANRKLVDVREPADMTSVAQGVLVGARSRLGNFGVINAAKDFLMGLGTDENQPTPGPGAIADIKAAIDQYRQTLDNLFPDDLLVTDQEGKKFDTPEKYLEAQLKKLDKALKHPTRFEGKVGEFVAAERNLASALIRAGCKSGVVLAGTPKTEDEFVKTGLYRELSVLRAQLRMTLRDGKEMAIRKEQEQQLRSIGLDPSKPPREGTYSFTVGAGLMGKVGDKLLSAQLGPKYNYTVELSVARNGEVTISSVHAVGLETSFSVDLLKRLGGSVSGGASVSRGKELTYANLEEFLRNSPGDLLVKLNGGLKGLFHSDARTDRLARETDNKTFQAMVTRYGVLDSTDALIMRPVGKKVVAEAKTVKVSTSGSISGKVKTGVADASVKVKVSRSTSHAVLTEYKPGYEQLSSETAMKAKSGLIFLRDFGTRYADISDILEYGDRTKTTAEEARQFIAANLQQLTERFDDFEHAVGYEQSRKKDYMAPPRHSVQGHLRDFFPDERVRGKRLNGPVIHVLEAYQATLSALTFVGKDLEGGAELLDKVKALQERVLDLGVDTDIDRAKQKLYTSKTRDKGISYSTHGDLQLNVGGLAFDAVSGVAPSIKAGITFSQRDEDDLIGLPDTDTEVLEMTVSGANIPFAQAASTIAQKVLQGFGVGNAVRDTALASASDAFGITEFPSKAASVGKSLLGITSGGGFDLPGFLSLDFGTDGSTELELKMKYIRSPDGKWMLSGVQTYKSSDSSVEGSATISSGAVGISLSGSAGMSKSVMLHEKVVGNSLVPLLKMAKEYDVSPGGADNVQWNTFLGQNASAVNDLVANLQKDGSVAARELGRYAEAASLLKKGDNPKLAAALNEAMDQLRGASGKGTRQKALSNLLGVLSKISSAVAQEKPFGAIRQAQREKTEAKQLLGVLGKPIDVDLAPDTDASGAKLNVGMLGGIDGLNGGGFAV